MNRKQIVHHLKRRWELASRIETEELMRTTLREKFDLTLELFELGRDLGLVSRENNRDNKKSTGTNWLRLKTRYHEAK